MTPEDRIKQLEAELDDARSTRLAIKLVRTEEERDQLRIENLQMYEALEEIAKSCPIIERDIDLTKEKFPEDAADAYFKSTRRRRDIAKEALKQFEEHEAKERG